MLPLLLFFSLAGPCITAETQCTERVAVGPQGRWSLVYRTHPLTARNELIHRALVMVHGQGRNADDYFRTALAAAFLAGGLEDTLVVSPRFASNDGRSCRDTLAEGEINYRCTQGSWRDGDVAIEPPAVNSFDTADEILRRLARKDVFPNLKLIVVAGHSAGGQFAHRYAAASKVTDTLGVPIRFVVANPSSYLYLGPERLPPSATCSEKGGCSAEFGTFEEGRNCTTYNRWLYGLEERRGYSAGLSDEQLRKQLVKRDVVYLLGENDTIPQAGFDSSCPAMAQGASRLARGVTYWNYVRSRYHAEHKLVTVPLCGHNARCMFTADPALNVVFQKP